MNREMILRVADAIEAAAKHEATPELGFNMANWRSRVHFDRTGHDCGTTACIAGWTVYLHNGQLPASVIGIEPKAQKLLGINEYDAVYLFYAVGLRQQRDTIQPVQAVKVLRHLAETGDVNWSLAARDQTP